VLLVARCRPSAGNCDNPRPATHAPGYLPAVAQDRAAAAARSSSRWPDTRGEGARGPSSDVLHLYPYREESLSLAPDGSPCVARTRGVLQRASVSAAQQHFVDKETLDDGSSVTSERIAIEVDGVPTANDRRGHQTAPTAHCSGHARVDVELEPAHAGGGSARRTRASRGTPASCPSVI
jgi:hypothetical protein